ncbi:hypothetical protein T492DRAFT_935501 [Pavlovales sp. CCMP2436]|nr:hypothetical protein T492DRAFT_935501 [Pavlovales sp. CCMP2436]
MYVLSFSRILELSLSITGALALLPDSASMSLPDTRLAIFLFFVFFDILVVLFYPDGKDEGPMSIPTHSPLALAGMSLGFFPLTACCPLHNTTIL